MKKDSQGLSKERIIRFVLFLSVFLFFFFFFARLHPIIVFDTDDWLGISGTRDAVPVFGTWNPIRVFAETMLPLVSETAVYLLTPLTGDFLTSLTIGHAAAVAAAIAALSFAVYIYIAGRCPGLGCKSAVALTILFLLCHFWVFRIEEENNKYMLLTVDACTYFYYVIPNLLNCCAALLAVCCDDLLSIPKKGDNYLKKGLFILLVYFCVFSNIWSSILLAVVLFWRTVFDWRRVYRSEGFCFKRFLADHAIAIAVLCAWFLSQLMEMSGGRSAIGDNNSVIGNIHLCLRNALQLIRGMNRFFMVFALIIVVGGIALIVIRKEKSELQSVGFWFLSACFVAIYLLLSCAKAGPSYLLRPDVFYCLFFCGAMILLICLATVIRKWPIIKVLFPLLLIIIFFNCNTSSKTYKDAYVGVREPGYAYAIDRCIIQQLLDAEEAKLGKTTIIVPVFDSDDNWPIPLGAGMRYSFSMYKLGLLDYPIYVEEMIASEELNHKLGL